MTLTADEAKARAAGYLEPIAGDSPAGANASYDPRYEALRAEIAGLDSPTGGEVDWVSVHRRGRELLTGVSKDLLIAAYTVFALVETEKLAGFAVGVELLQGLFDRYWDSMFPPAARLRGRGNALDWLVARLEFRLPQLPVGAADRPALDLVKTNYRQFSNTAREKLGEHCPSMRGVEEVLQRIDLKIPAAAAPAPVASPAPSMAAAASGPGGAVGAAVQTASTPVPPPLLGTFAPGASAAVPSNGAGTSSNGASDGTHAAGSNGAAAAPSFAPPTGAAPANPTAPGSASAPSNPATAASNSANPSAASNTANPSAASNTANTPAAPNPASPSAASNTANTSAASNTANTPAASNAATPTAAVDPLDALLEEANAWLAPISPGAPAGADAKFDPIYEEVRVEIAKLDSLAGEIPVWKTVESRSDTILKTKSKDVLIACYFAYARYKERGLAALPLGLAVLTGLLDRYAESMFPNRPRGRGNAVGWFVGQLEVALAEEKLKPDDRPTVVLLEKIVRRFGTEVRSRLEDNAPSVGPIGDRVQRMLLAVPEKKPEPVPETRPTPPPPPQPTATPTATTQAAPAATPMPAVADVGAAEDVGKFLLETGRAFTKAASLLRRANPKHATAYRLLRSGLWLHLETPPPADAGGKTMVPPLPAPRRTQFATIANNSKWDALLEETESALGQFRFSLDLNRLSCQALDGLGKDYEPAKQAVLAEVGALLRRFPTLLDLTASDGSPFADADTKAWIAAELSTGAASVSSGDDLPDDGGAFAEIRSMMKGGKAADAMKQAMTLIDGTGTPRARFARRLALAEACLEGNQAIVARGMFAALERELRERGLVEWEPALAGRCLEGFMKSIRQAAKAGNKYDEADRVFERLCLVDPAAAARLST